MRVMSLKESISEVEEQAFHNEDSLFGTLTFLQTNSKQGSAKEL